MEVYEFIPYIVLLDNNNPPVANLSNYVIPEFYSAEYDQNTKLTTIVWYDSIECSQLYVNPSVSVQHELIPWEINTG